MGMGVRAAALSPMHTWVRFARADDAAVAITCRRKRPPVYIANAHVMYNIYVYICNDAKSGHVTPTRCVRASARVRVRLGAHAFAPNHASAFGRRGPRVARRAGVLLGGGVQREHRRVEHRACYFVVRGMRRLSGPGGAPVQAGRARLGRRCGAGRYARCAVGTLMRARVCAQTYSRVCTCVGIAARSRDGLHVSMYMYVYV